MKMRTGARLVLKLKEGGIYHGRRKSSEYAWMIYRLMAAAAQLGQLSKRATGGEQCLSPAARPADMSLAGTRCLESKYIMPK
jgi:hypothetical protein